MLIIWAIIFVVALAVMIKGADWFLEGAEVIGLSFGLSPFIVGVVIVGLGTSFPEIISSLFAVWEGATEIVTANAIGSNIANILLVVGLSAIVGRRLAVSKSLIDLDLPLLAITTVLFLGFVWDGTVTFVEALILIVAYLIYLIYTFIYEDDTVHDVTKKDVSEVDLLPNRGERRKKAAKKTGHAIGFASWIRLLFGLVGLALGAKYLIESVIHISEFTGLATGVITLAAVALGTSLPEILVSVKAAWNKKPEIALGNIFGSNVFNLLIVVGLPGLFKELTVDETTLMLGVPVLIAATLLFVISGISRRIHMWEGWMYLLVYIFFIGKLFELF